MYYYDLLDLLSLLYYDRPVRSTVFIILQQTSCIYCLHFTLAIVVGLPSPQQSQIGYFIWGWGGAADTRISHFMTLHVYILLLNLKKISYIFLNIINFKQGHQHDKNLPVQNNVLSRSKNIPPQSLNESSYNNLSHLPNQFILKLCVHLYIQTQIQLSLTQSPN